MKRSVLLDSVDLGIESSERHHRPFGELARGNPNILNLYRGPTRVAPERDLCHFREAPQMSAIHLSVPPEYAGTDVEVEIALRCYAYGDVKTPPKPTFLHAMGRTQWFRLAISCRS